MRNKTTSFSKEKIHAMFCDMPADQKLNMAIQCAAYGIKPCDLERAVSTVMTKAQIDFHVVLSNISYWTKEK